MIKKKIKHDDWEEEAFSAASILMHSLKSHMKGGVN